MKLEKKIYKKKYLLLAKKNLEKEENIKIKVEENKDNWIVDGKIGLKLADYYIYIYNENN